MNQKLNQKLIMKISINLPNSTEIKNNNLLENSVGKTTELLANRRKIRSKSKDSLFKIKPRSQILTLTDTLDCFDSSKIVKQKIYSDHYYNGVKNSKTTTPCLRYKH